MESGKKQMFNELCLKIKQIKISDFGREDNGMNLNSIIDDLNALECQDFLLDQQVTEEALTTLVQLVSHKNDHMLSKFCHLIYSLMHKQKITLSRESLHSLMEFFLKSVNSCGLWVMADVLSALGALIYENVGHLEQFYDVLLGSEGILINLAQTGKHAMEIQYMALKCLQALTAKKQPESYLSDHHLLNSYNLCIEHLKHPLPEVTDAVYFKVLISSLKCLQNIFSSKNFMVQNIGELLGTLKVLLYFGFPGQKPLAPACLYPTLMTQYIPEVEVPEEANSFPKFRKQNRKLKRNRSKKKHVSDKLDDQIKPSKEDLSDSDNSYSSSGFSSASSSFTSYEQPPVSNWFKSSSSDSEFSDVEVGQAKIRSFHSSIRQNAYACLQAVFKVMEKKLVFGYWSSFLPDSSSSVGASYSMNIFSTILKDPSPQVRFGALSLLADMLRGSKQFLSLVDDSSSSRTSFTTISSVLSAMVGEIHRRLLLALVSENTSSLLTQILKCFAILIENVPYKRVNPEVLLKLVQHLKSFLCHKDIQVQVACLTVFGSIINSNQVPDIVIEEILHLDSSDAFSLTQPTNTEAAKPQVSSEQCSVRLPWIVMVCKSNIMNEKFPFPLPVRLESLQVLGIFVGKHFDIMRPFISVLEQLVLYCLNDLDFSVQLHGAKFLEVIGRCMLLDVNEGSKEANVGDVITAETAFQFWNQIVSGPLPACLTNETQKTVQSVGCDCLSTIPPQIFAQFREKIQILYMTLMLGLASETDQSVQGAAIRCLGIYSLFPCLRENLAFLSDVANILVVAVKDSNFNIRSKASWALGNLSDALFLSRDQFPGFDSQVSISFFHSVSMASVIASQDCDRVRSNAVRALGNFLRYVPLHFLENPRIMEFVKQATDSLLAALSASITKVRWNACYALGNAFKNTDLVYSQILKVKDILKGLLGVLKCTNFKVRINATLALSALPSRESYEDLYVIIWRQLIESLYAAQADVNFKELKHHENLCDQICFSMCQLSVHMKHEDIKEIYADTLDAGELLLTFMWKFGSRTTVDKVSVICLASDHFSSLIHSGGLSDESLQLLNLLQEIWDQVKMAFYQQESTRH